MAHTVVLQTLLTLVLLILCGSLLPIFLAVLLVRLVVVHLARVWDRDIDRSIVGIDSIYALKRDSIRNKFIITVLVLENGSTETVPQLREMFAQTIMTRNKTEFQKLWQYPANFGGFAFWKTNRKFRICDHIREYDHGGEASLPSPCYFEDIPNVAASLQSVEFPSGKSPWELLLIRDVVTDRENPESELKSILILRLDHVIGDGLSVIFAARCFFNFHCSHATPNSGTVPSQMSLISKILFPLRCLHDFSNVLVHSLGREPLKNISVTGSTATVCAMTQQFPFEVIKGFKAKYGIPISTILHGINFEATVRALKELGEPIPKSLSTAVYIPLPNRPKDLGTYMAALQFFLTTEGNMSALDVLQSVHLQLKEQSEERPRMSYASLGIVHLFGYLPIAWREGMLSYFTHSMDIPLSTVPMLSLPESVAGLRCTDVITFVPATAYGIQGITGGSNGQARFFYSTRKGFLHPELLPKLCSHAIDVVYELSKKL